MLSYIVPAEDKRSFSNQGDEFAALSQEDGSSPIAKARPLLNIAVLHNNKAPTPRDNLMTANPAGNTSPPGGVRQQQKQELFLSRVVENGDRSPVMSESRSVGSDLVLTPGSDDKSIVKSTSAKPNLKSHSYFYSRGGHGFFRQPPHYSPLPPVPEVPYSSNHPGASPYRSSSGVRSSRASPQIPVRTWSCRTGFRYFPDSSTRSPIPRPCMRLKKFEATSPVSPRAAKYCRLTDISERAFVRPGAGSRLLRVVAGGGRGYLRCREGGGNLLDSGSSTPSDSPRDSPTVSPRGPQSGILTSSVAKSGIKRISRVSFGSSKGSMVETLIYESPVAEEDRIPEEDAPITDPVAQKFTAETAEPQKPASKVRVTFFESEKPLAVTSPEPDFFGPSFCDFATMSSPAPDAILAHTFDRQLSSENGKDNPFRPDGDISREADEIVQLIKSGRPLDSSLTSPDGLAKDTPDSSLKKSSAGANGSAPSTSPGPVEVKHATVTPSASAQVEHVVLKKKSKCGCCVIQ